MPIERGKARINPTLESVPNTPALPPSPRRSGLGALVSRPSSHCSTASKLGLGMDHPQPNNRVQCRFEPTAGPCGPRWSPDPGFGCPGPGERDRRPQSPARRPNKPRSNPALGSRGARSWSTLRVFRSNWYPLVHPTKIWTQKREICAGLGAWRRLQVRPSSQNRIHARRWTSKL